MPSITEQTPQQELETSPDQSAISFLGGMGYDQHRNQNAVDYIASLGRPVISALTDPDISNAPKGYRVTSSVKGTRVVPRPIAYLETSKPDTLLISSRQQEARADELIAHVESQTTEPVTHIAQSADAQNAIIAAYKRPDLFKNLILLFPSGMVKKQYRTEYLRQTASSLQRGKERVPKEVVLPENDFEATSRPTSLREQMIARRYKKSGGYTVAASAIAAYNNNLLHGLRQKEQTPNVAMILGTKDLMMKPDRIIESLISADDVDYILVTNTEHGLNGRKDLTEEMLELTVMMDARKTEKQAAQARGEVLPPTSLTERLLFMADVSEEDKNRLRTVASAVPMDVQDEYSLSF